MSIENVKIKTEYKANLKKLAGTDDPLLIKALSCLLKLTFKSGHDAISKGKLSNWMKTVLYHPNPKRRCSLSPEARSFCEELMGQGIPRGVMNLILDASFLPVILDAAFEKDEEYQNDKRESSAQKKETIKELKHRYDTLLDLKPYLSNQDCIDLLEKIARSRSNDDYFSTFIRFMAAPEIYNKDQLRSKSIVSFKEILLKFEEKYPQFKGPKKGRPTGSFSEGLFLKCLSEVFKHYRIPDYVRRAGQFITFLKGRREVYSDTPLKLAASSKYSKRLRRRGAWR